MGGIIKIDKGVMRMKQNEDMNALVAEMEEKNIHVGKQSINYVQLIIILTIVGQIIFSFLPTFTQSVLGHYRHINFINMSGLLAMIIAVIVGVTSYMKKRLTSLAFSIMNGFIVSISCLNDIDDLSIGGYLLLVDVAIMIIATFVLYWKHRYEDV